MGATLTSMDAALKETWTENDLEEQIYQDNPFLDDIERTTRYKVGAQAVTPLHTARNAGYTTLAAGGGTLNAAGQQGTAQAVWNYTHHHQQVLIQGDVIDGTSDDSLSVANVIDVEVEGALNDMRKQITRQAFGTGNGVISGVLTDAGADDTIDLAAIAGHNAIERGWLYVGAVVDVGSTADTDGTVDGIAVIAVTDSETVPTIQLASGTYTTTAGTESVYWHEACGGGAQTASREMNGLGNIVASKATALGGIAANAEATWDAYVDSTSQALTLNLLNKTARQAQQKTGTPPDYALTGLKQAQNLYELLQVQTRFSGDSGFDTGNTDKVKYAGMTINVHPDCQNEKFYLLQRKHLKICAVDKPYWVNKIEGGGSVLRWVQGTDGYGSKISYRIQLITNRRNAHAVLSGLT
jgi:hypothetical protein